MKNGKLVRITAMFFALMLCFTILSRAADQLSVAVVQTERPQNRMIEHAVRTSGKIEQNQELAVTTLSDQRVTAIYVREGQRVAKGDLLFEIDTTLLEEQILNQQQEMEKQELQVKDSKSQKEVNAQQKANSQAQAAEQYSLSTRQAGVQLARAKQQLNDAKMKLKEFRESMDAGKAGTSNGIGTVDSDVEAALLQALEDKTNEYVAAQGELRTLEWEIENAVYTARQNAMAGVTAALTMEDKIYTGSADANLVAEERIFTGSAEPEVVSNADNVAAIADAEPEVVPDADNIATIADVEEPEIVPDIAEEDGVLADNIGAADFNLDFDLNMEIEDVMNSDAETDRGIVSETDDGIDNTNIGNTNIGNMNTGNTNTGNTNTGNTNTGNTNTGNTNTGNMSIGNMDTGAQIVPDGSEQPVSQEPTPEELAQLEQTVRESYSQKLQAAQKKVSDAEAAKEAAEAALMQYQQEQLAVADSANVQNAQQLVADLKTAQQAYEDAAIAANEAAVTSSRAVAIANVPDASNSSDRMSEISYEQMELTLEKLERLEKAKGKICAETDGLITKINIMTGEKTSDTTALLMADLAKGYRFTADITKEQQKYIGTNDPVKLTSGDGKQKLEDLPVESVAEDESDEGIYHVTVQIPEDTFEIGANVTMDFSKKSETYAVTVPLSALHLDEKQQPYVLVAEEYESIMGTEQRARKVSVTVLEQNESYAALADGVIGSEAEIIVQSDKAIDNGSRVRVAA